METIAFGGRRVRGVDSRGIGNRHRLSADCGRYWRGDPSYSVNGRLSNRKHHLVRLVTGEGGWLTIEALYWIPILFALLFITVQIWGVITIYNNTQSLEYYTISRMQVSGGLTSQQEQWLYNGLVKIGADPDTIKITGSVTPGRTVKWPNEVRLKIEFVPEYFNGITAQTLMNGSPGRKIKIGVDAYAISQKT